MSKAVAIIGMGQMGAEVGARLAEVGYSVSGYDIDQVRRGKLTAAGFEMFDTIGQAVSGADIVISSLPDPAAVRAAWLAPDGIVTRAQSGALCVELSTIDPEAMREVAKAAAERGLAVVDCPVSGSPREARAGKLVLIAGGKAEALERAKPLLEKLGSDCKFTGDVGTAKVVKIVNNMMSMANILAAAEAFALGVAAGVDPKALYDVLSVSGGRSNQFTKRFPGALQGDFAPGFKIELGEKDLALGIDLGRRTRSPTPTASAVRELYGIALAEGYRGKDIVSVLAMYQAWAGVGRNVD